MRRTEYADANVRSRAFWLKSMKTRLPRSSFHHDVVTASGARRSTSRASAIPARRTAMKSQSVLMRRNTCTPRPPDVFGYPTSPSSSSSGFSTSTAIALASLKPGPGLRVQIDAQLVRMLGIGAAHLPRMQCDRAHLRGPHDRRRDA